MGATPHFYAHLETLDAFLQRRVKAAKLMYETLSFEHVPTVKIGAEVFLCTGMERMEGVEQLCFSESRTLLIEMPTSYWGRPLIETLLKLEEDRGLNVVIAHLDRYAHKPAEELLKLGFRAQLNADALVKLHYRRRLLRWVRAGHIVALGSDIHGCKRNYSAFLKAVDILGNQGKDIMHISEQILHPFWAGSAHRTGELCELGLTNARFIDLRLRA